MAVAYIGGIKKEKKGIQIAQKRGRVKGDFYFVKKGEGGELMDDE